MASARSLPDRTTAPGQHSHDVVAEILERIRVLDPASATGAAPAEGATMTTVDVADGELAVSLHEA